MNLSGVLWGLFFVLFFCVDGFVSHDVVLVCLRGEEGEGEGKEWKGIERKRKKRREVEL